MRAVLLVSVVAVSALASLAGCADERPADPRLESFAALYAPVGTTESGFSVELRQAVPLADRDLQERLAYTLRFGGIAGPPEGGPEFALDAGFQLVRQTFCVGHGPATPDCSERQLKWPDAGEPAPWGIGWTVAAPPGTERTAQGTRTLLVHDNVRYEYEGGRLAPDRIVLADDWGYELVAYDVLGPLGGADDWPEPPAPLANETRGFQVHPDEERDFLGVGWSTKDAMDHLATHAEAGTILREGGCVLHFGVLSGGTDPLLPVPAPLPIGGGPSVHVWLQDRDGDSTNWFFHQEGTLLGEPRFSEPEGDDLFPFKSDLSCEERRSGPAPRMSLADAWERSRALVKDPDSRGYLLSVFHLPPDHGHGGFSPGNRGFEARAGFFPSDQDGLASGVDWDLLSGTMVGLLLTGEDAASA